MKVMVFGTFDNLHPGHRDYFRQARRFGEELIAIVARDRNVLRIKGRATHENEKTRVKKVRAALKEMKGVAVLGAVKNQWAVLKKYRPDIICLGYDQKVDLARLKREIAKSCPGCKIRRMKAYYPKKYKSSYCRK
jgi:FAD synthetase